MSDEVCVSVWRADPDCVGWSHHGNPLHGCYRNFGHMGIHKCKCGSECLKQNVLPPPRVR